jgi:hypothetical protein
VDFGNGEKYQREREFIVKWKDLGELRVWRDMAFGGGG